MAGAVTKDGIPPHPFAHSRKSSRATCVHSSIEFTEYTNDVTMDIVLILTQIYIQNVASRTVRRYNLGRIVQISHGHWLDNR